VKVFSEVQKNTNRMKVGIQ